jgi:transposase
MEAPMKRHHFIGIDVHSQFCETAVVNPAGKVVQRDRCDTTIPALVQVLDKVPRPCTVVIEEGPMAGWLWPNLHDKINTMVVAEPRRNRLISHEGDKDDDLDAEKLAQLCRAGMIKPVHQVESTERAVFKQLVSVYHYRVRQRVREAHRITHLLRQHGVVVREKNYAAAEDRKKLLARLPAHEVLRTMVRALWLSYDALVKQERQWRHRLVKEAKEIEVVRHFEELPGFGWVRSATLYAYMDTPWRFRSKAAAWKYLGIGLERKRSGKGPEYLGVPRITHRLLKCTILGAAKSAAAQGDNPFADLYRRWLDNGLSTQLARRSVARRQAATIVSMWKNGNAYRPELVVAAATAKTAAKVSR